MLLSFCHTYFDRKVRRRIYGNTAVINVCYREKVINQTKMFFYSVSNHKASCNTALSHLHHLMKKKRQTNKQISSNPKIPTSILMTFIIQKNTFSFCFSLNHDILPLLKGHFNWHSCIQERSLLFCKTLQRFYYYFTSQCFCWRLHHQASYFFLSALIPDTFKQWSEVTKDLMHKWAGSHLVFIILAAFCKPRRLLILGVYKEQREGAFTQDEDWWHNCSSPQIIVHLLGKQPCPRKKLREGSWLLGMQMHQFKNL